MVVTEKPSLNGGMLSIKLCRDSSTAGIRSLQTSADYTPITTPSKSVSFLLLNELVPSDKSVRELDLNPQI